jgi:spore coat polysaccharide biosynthesis protein SpsF
MINVENVKVVACIQARMGSSRLPGKVMLPLDGSHVLEHDVRRVAFADSIDQIVVATTDKKRDDIITRYAQRVGASVYRGSEDDVLERMYEAANEHNADVVVRATGDNPLVSPDFIDTAVEELLDSEVDYVSAHLERTFPCEVTVEAFTFESFSEIEAASDQPHQREHVTPYYYENPDDFNLHNVTSDDIFDKEYLRDRTDLRLTLDEADDYELLRRIYDEIEYDEIVDLAEAVEYIDQNELMEINQHVSQKSI